MSRWLLATPPLLLAAACLPEPVPAAGPTDAEIEAAVEAYLSSEAGQARIAQEVEAHLATALDERLADAVTTSGGNHDLESYVAQQLSDGGYYSSSDFEEADIAAWQRAAAPEVDILVLSDPEPAASTLANETWTEVGFAGTGTCPNGFEVPADGGGLYLIHAGVFLENASGVQDASAEAFDSRLTLDGDPIASFSQLNFSEPSETTDGFSEIQVQGSALLPGLAPGDCVALEVWRESDHEGDWRASGTQPLSSFMATRLGG